MLSLTRLKLRINLNIFDYCNELEHDTWHDLVKHDFDLINLTTIATANISLSSRGITKPHVVKS